MYDAVQEGRPGPPKSRDVRGKNIPKFATCKHGDDLVRDRGKQITHCQSPSGAHGRKA